MLSSDLEPSAVFGSNDGWLGAPGWPLFSDGDPDDPGLPDDEAVEGEPDDVLGELLELLGEPDEVLGDPCLP